MLVRELIAKLEDAHATDVVMVCGCEVIDVKIMHGSNEVWLDIDEDDDDAKEDE